MLSGGEYLGVDHRARLLGVASGLGRILAAHVEKDKCCLIFKTMVPSKRQALITSA